MNKPGQFSPGCRPGPQPSDTGRQLCERLVAKLPGVLHELP